MLIEAALATGDAACGGLDRADSPELAATAATSSPPHGVPIDADLDRLAARTC